MPSNKKAKAKTLGKKSKPINPVKTKSKTARKKTSKKNSSAQKSTKKNAEKIKRLKPKPEVVRELFGKSGNRCYFPGCNEVIIGVVPGKPRGQIAHIEAASEDGPRFNKSSSNEKRRLFSNLMLLCYPHHNETDDEKIWTVKKMRAIKKDREKLFDGSLHSLIQNFVDSSKIHTPKFPKNVGKLVDHMNWGGWTAKDTDDYLADVRTLSERLNKIPLAERKLYTQLIEKATLPTSGMGIYRSLKILTQESVRAFNLTDREFKLIFDLYEDKNVAFEYTDEDNKHWIYLKEPGVDFCVLSDIRNFCKAKKIPLETVFVTLDFSLFQKGR